MKRISILLMTLALCAAPAARAQDAATEERLNKLSGSIEDLTATQQVLNSRIAALTKEVAILREQIGKPTGSYASQEDVKILKDAVKEIDSKRMADNKRIGDKLDDLRKTLLNSPVTSGKKAVSTASSSGSASAPDANTDHYEYVVKNGDTLSAIVAAYKEKNIKVTIKQILDFNPGLKPENLTVGKTIKIPAPKSTSP